MVNPDQKTILLEQAYEELKEICTKFQDESGTTDMEINSTKRTCEGLWKRYWWRIRHRLGSVNQVIGNSFAIN